MPFDPSRDYEIIPDKTRLKDFFDYSDGYVTRPPYQRKTVWSTKKQQSLLDSIVRGYYVPKLVLRKVRLNENRSIKEVVDGQQRIRTVQLFYENKLKLPSSLEDIHPDIPNKAYSKLPVEVRQYIDQQNFDVDVISSIEDARNPDHQRLATEIFWRLQQGESLTQMEIAHARLSSLGRNFVAKYADDIAFDFDGYQPLDTNPSKHRFFQILNRPNDRMQHLALLARMVLLSKNGVVDLKDGEIVGWIEDTVKKDGIGNQEFENEKEAKEALEILNFIVSLFSDDPMIKEGGKVKN